MEYKKRVIQMFHKEIGLELENYNREYQKILRDTTIVIPDSSFRRHTIANTETYPSQNPQQNKSYEVAYENLILTPTKDAMLVSENENIENDSEFINSSSLHETAETKQNAGMEFRNAWKISKIPESITEEAGHKENINNIVPPSSTNQEYHKDKKKLIFLTIIKCKISLIKKTKII